MPTNPTGPLPDPFNDEVQQRYMGVNPHTGFMYTVMDERMQAMRAPSPSHSTSLAKEEEVALQQAAARLSDNNQRSRRERRDIDERESEYRDSYFSDKAPNSPADIVNSEVPLCVDYYSGDTIRKIIEMGHPDIFHNQDRKFFRCSKCNREVPSHYMYFCLGRLYCSEHVPQVETCNVCLYPKESTKAITTFDGRQIHACASCIKQNRKCVNCGAPITEAEVVIRSCQGCRDRASNDGPMRPWSHASTYATDKTLGNIVKSSRIFSAELEMVFPPSGALIRGFASGLPKEVGLSTDGSIRGAGEGIEVQTPRLVGLKGEELVNLVSTLAAAAQGKVNDSCGFHVHLDGADLVPQSRREYPKALLALWGAHLAFEDVILSLVPYQRRFNRYSRPMRPYFAAVELEAVETIMEAEKLWYRQRSSEQLRSAKGHHYHSSRYFGINLHPLFAHGHFEVRYHPGTTNAKKILEWANLHALIVDAAVAGKFTPNVLVEAQMLDLGSKSNMLFDLIGLSKESRTYFYGRQSKFRNRAEKEDGTVEITRDRRATRGSLVDLVEEAYDELRDNDN